MELKARVKTVGQQFARSRDAVDTVSFDGRSSKKLRLPVRRHSILFSTHGRRVKVALLISTSLRRFDVLRNMRQELSAEAAHCK